MCHSKNLLQKKKSLCFRMCKFSTTFPQWGISRHLSPSVHILPYLHTCSHSVLPNLPSVQFKIRSHPFGPLYEKLGDISVDYQQIITCKGCCISHENCLQKNVEVQDKVSSDLGLATNWQMRDSRCSFVSCVAWVPPLLCSISIPMMD